ncbi:hypothetical protein Srufu_000660 [Streptomyces libani subsp. rufus]|nr:hypothetical protein Srufu_000660 [Streptomyces libani subsp. rufus]
MVRAHGLPQGISRRTTSCWSAAAYAPGVRGVLRTDTSRHNVRPRLRNGTRTRNRQRPGTRSGSPVFAAA